MPWRTVRRLILLLTLLPLTAAAQIPSTAWGHRNEMVHSAWRIHGPGAPVAALAAQIHQESGWDCFAVSWAKAKGCAQFTDSTAAGMARNHPDQCAPVNQFDPSWSWRCRDLLMRDTKIKSLGSGLTECDSWAFDFRWYNGGPLVEKDRRLAAANGANPDDWQAVTPFNAGRKPSAWKENTEYPLRIYRLEARYAEWGRQLGCL